MLLLYIVFMFFAIELKKLFIREHMTLMVHCFLSFLLSYSGAQVSINYDINLHRYRMIMNQRNWLHSFLIQYYNYKRQEVEKEKKKLMDNVDMLKQELGTKNKNIQLLKDSITAVHEAVMTIKKPESVQIPIGGQWAIFQQQEIRHNQEIQKITIAIEDMYQSSLNITDT